MKRLFALTLALIMVLSMATVAFADENTNAASEPELGSVTINGIAVKDGTLEPVATYSVYRILDLESYNTTSGAYSYKINSAWTNFILAAEQPNPPASGEVLPPVLNPDVAPYLSVDTSGYVTWIGGDSDDNVAAFAKLALDYAKKNGISAIKSSATTGQFVVDQKLEDDGTTTIFGKFSGLPLGWYLVDTTTGALCGLTTTNPDASINAKNGSPTIDKQVQEDSTSNYGDSNTADIGQTVNFMTTINVHAGAQNYVLHDTMSIGLTFKPETVRAEHIVPGTTTTTTEVPANMYTVVTEGIDDGCTFHVVFEQEFCDHLQTNDKVVVYYSAMLNRNAVVAGDGNGNETRLQFGENHTTTTDKTKTYTFSFDVVKTDSQNTLIDGAVFRIYDAATAGAEVPVVILECVTTENADEALKDEHGNFIRYDHDNNALTEGLMVKEIKSYRRARSDESGIPIFVKNGLITVKGFDNGTYYLEEIEAPDGYNKLNTRQKFIISDGNLSATFNGGTFSTGSGVHVVNKTGSMLPETGAMGTLMFISFGMFVALGTGILLVTKKRMSMIEE